MDALKQALTEDLGGTPSVSVFGLFQVPESVVVTWIIMAALVLASVLLTRRLRRVPGKAQTVLEMGVSFLNDFCKENLGEHWRPFAPWIGTVALYITAANLSGLFGLAPPTRDLTITAALALMSMVLIYGGQFRYRGLKGGLKKFAQPSPVLLPIN